MSAFAWTTTQCEILARAVRTPDGAVLRGSGQIRAAQNLEWADMGRLARLPKGASRFYVNAAGRAAVHDAIVHAEAKAASDLGDANEAAERGYVKRSATLMQRCQEWLDVANELREQGSLRPPGER